MNKSRIRCVVHGLMTGLALLGCTFAATAAPQVHTVAKGLEHPWAVAFLPDGGFLVTERPGRLRVIAPDGTLGVPVQGLPEVAGQGQGGLLDLVLDSNFKHNRTLYFCFSEPAADGTNGTALARARLSEDRRRLERLQVIFRQQPKVRSRLHFGCRIVERMLDGKPDGTLFLTLGERFSQREQAQALDSHLGKVVRVGKGGSVPADNPFAQQDNALPEIWSYGHRNGQGATMGPDDRLWMHEHGPMGGDEINRLQPAANHGWPLVSFGLNYDGSPVGDGASEMPGVQPPLYQWTPSIAPSGMVFLDSGRYGEQWRDSLFVGALKFRHLERLTVEDGRVRAREVLLRDLRERIRDVRQGPDGLLYLLTDSGQGRLLRLDP